MKQRIAMVLLIALLVCGICGCSQQKESPAEDFLYEMVDGQVIIIGYTGSDREIVIPAKIADREVTKIGDYAFEGYDLTNVVFPDSLKEIGEGAFYRCKCLTAVSIPESVEVIGAGAFNSCLDLSELKLPDNIESIGECAFGNCAKLDEIDIDEALVKSIYRWYSSSGELELETVTNYTCDTEGNLISAVSGSGENETVRTYSYDEQGNLVTILESARGIEKETSYTYDDDGRIVCITLTRNSDYGDNRSTIEYVYDKWKLERIESSGYYRIAEFDWRGRIIQLKSYNQGTTTSYDTTEYNYDEFGRKKIVLTTNYDGSKYEIEYFYNR